MNKIPTMFQRSQENRWLVIPVITPGCEWVTDGEGYTFEKLDGMNVRITVRNGDAVRLEKRRNPSKPQKRAGILDPWYVDTMADEDKHLYTAYRNTITGLWPDGEHCCEAIGPKIQGNPLDLAEPTCVPVDLRATPDNALDVPRKPKDLCVYVEDMTSVFTGTRRVLAEGIVFHHPDGRRAKIKRKDFGFPAELEDAVD